MACDCTQEIDWAEVVKRWEYKYSLDMVQGAVLGWGVTRERRPPWSVAE